MGGYKGDGMFSTAWTELRANGLSKIRIRTAACIPTHVKLIDTAT
jgi:hypothetical protein